MARWLITRAVSVGSVRITDPAWTSPLVMVWLSQFLRGSSELYTKLISDIRTQPNQEFIGQSCKMPTRLSPCRLVVRVYGATADKMLRDIEHSAVGKIVSILANTPSTETVTEAKPTGKPAVIAEDLFDILTTHINQTVGASLNNFVVLLPVSLVAVLERAAQLACIDIIEDLIGAGVQPYTGTDHGICMLPKMFTSLSYRERTNGDVWKIEATRNPNAQGWDIEIMTVVDIVANGKVRVKLTADGLQTGAVAFPMITRIALS